ncbi:MAG: hypothetical protein JOZ39_08285 [Chloroflexi bacterium]|nr:hypothetical protein [Chloroflexota bacterium]
MVDRTQLTNLEQKLERLEWGDGLTRDEVRGRLQDLPEDIFLELPASKRFQNGRELLREAINAPNRAEGELVRADFDSFQSTGAAGDGGPQAWGEDPILGTHEEP